MKLLVNELPESGNECLFHEKSFKIEEVSPGKFEKRKCNYCSFPCLSKKKECSIDLDKKCRYLIEQNQ